MILTEDAARWMLVLHTATSVATVGALTHLVIWMRGYRRGDTARHQSVKKFALIALALYACNFTIGNVMYPTYRTMVRAEYLDSPDEVVDDATRRAEAHARSADRNHAPEPEVGEAKLDRHAKARADQAMRAARWFDVKEHWVALGLTLTAALTLILFAWRPKADSDSRVIAPYTLLMAGGAAGAVWIAAIIGVLTAAWRAI